MEKTIHLGRATLADLPMSYFFLYNLNMDTLVAKQSEKIRKGFLC